MKDINRQKILKLPETNQKTQPIPRAGLNCQCPRETVGGLAGRRPPPSEITRTKYSDCPQDPRTSHLVGYRFEGSRDTMRVGVPTRRLEL